MQPMFSGFDASNPMSYLGAGMDVLDLPGALARGLLAGHPGERYSAPELAEQWGWHDPSALGSTALSMATDPLSYLAGLGPALRLARGAAGLGHGLEAAEAATPFLKSAAFGFGAPLAGAAVMDANGPNGNPYADALATGLMAAPLAIHAPGMLRSAGGRLTGLAGAIPGALAENPLTSIMSKGLNPGVMPERGLMPGGLEGVGGLAGGAETALRAKWMDIKLSLEQHGIAAPDFDSWRANYEAVQARIASQQAATVGGGASTTTLAAPPPQAPSLADVNNQWLAYKAAHPGEDQSVLVRAFMQERQPPPSDRMDQAVQRLSQPGVPRPAGATPVASPSAAEQAAVQQAISPITGEYMPGTPPRSFIEPPQPMPPQTVDARALAEYMQAHPPGASLAESMLAPHTMTAHGGGPGLEEWLANQVHEPIFDTTAADLPIRPPMPAGGATPPIIPEAMWQGQKPPMQAAADTMPLAPSQGYLSSAAPPSLYKLPSLHDPEQWQAGNREELLNDKVQAVVNSLKQRPAPNVPPDEAFLAARNTAAQEAVQQAMTGGLSDLARRHIADITAPGATTAASRTAKARDLLGMSHADLMQGLQKALKEGDQPALLQYTQALGGVAPTGPDNLNAVMAQTVAKQLADVNAEVGGTTTTQRLEKQLAAQQEKLQSAGPRAAEKINKEIARVKAAIFKSTPGGGGPADPKGIPSPASYGPAGNLTNAAVRSYSPHVSGSVGDVQYREPFLSGARDISPLLDSSEAANLSAELPRFAGQGPEEEAAMAEELAQPKTGRQLVEQLRQQQQQNVSAPDRPNFRMTNEDLARLAQGPKAFPSMAAWRAAHMAYMLSLLGAGGMGGAMLAHGLLGQQQAQAI